MAAAEFKNLKAQRHRHSSLSIHPYFGKVDPSIVAAALSNFSSVGQTVMDPFCGSGTVVHDAVLAGRSVIGFDSSPLACMIATAKVLGIRPAEEKELSAWAAQLTQEADLFSSESLNDEVSALTIPSMPRVRSVSDWFGPNTLVELARIKRALSALEKLASPEVGLLARVAFSRIITQASFQKGESTYSRTQKEDSADRVRGLLAGSVKAVIKSARAFSEELRQAGLPPPSSSRLEVAGARSTITQGGIRAVLVNGDSRTNQTQQQCLPKFDLVITSPPYLMSWDYGLYHKFRFYWLGFNLDQYEETEIGRHLRRQDDDVQRYTSDMTDVFSALRSYAHDAAWAVFVNAPSVVYGKLVDTNELLRACAVTAGWRFVSSSDSVGIPGPHHGMYASLGARQADAPGTPGKREHVLVFAA